MAQAGCLTLLLISCSIFHCICAVPFKQDSAVNAEITLTNNGVNATFVDDQPSLNYDAVSQLCHAGVWITYTGADYTFGGLDGIIEIFPKLEPTCQAPYDPRVRSTRTAGLTADYAAPGVSLYGEVAFQGLLTGFVEGTGVEQLKSNVIGVVTVKTRVEIFQEANYQGASVCLEPHPNECVGDVCFIPDLTKTHEFPFDITLAQSAKAGCNVLSKIHKMQQSAVPPTVFYKQ